jgi:putative nucleotidyltransferase with HDIG domain
VIEVLNKKRSLDYNKYDLTILLSLSNQIALLIENARLFEESEKKIQEFSTIIKVSKMISSTLNLKNLLKISMDLAKEVMKAEASSLMLLDEEKNELVFEVALGEKGEEIKEYRIPIGKGISGWVAKYGKPLLISDVSKDKRFFKELDKKTKFKTRNILCVPLKMKDKILGVIEVINALGRECFSQDDVRFFEVIAGEIAVAIQNAKLFRDLEDLFFDTIKSLAQAIDARDPYTRGHSERVTRYSEIIAKEMNLSPKEREIIREAGLLHDIGKIGIRDGILLKPSHLTEEEFEQIKKHPDIGYNIVNSIRHLRHIVPGIRSHHERVDGGGYPDNLKGDEIPLYGRIICVADAFDAMTSDRPYRKGLSKEEAVKRIKNNVNSQFDPKVVKAFISAYEKGKIKP